MNHLDFIKPPTDTEPDFVRDLRAGREAQATVLQLMKRAQGAPANARSILKVKSSGHPWAATLQQPPRPAGERLGDELLGKITRADVVQFPVRKNNPPKPREPRPPSREPLPLAAKFATASMTKQGSRK